MALIKCLECNREVSSFATVCPSCGAPVLVEQTASNGNWTAASGQEAWGTIPANVHADKVTKEKDERTHARLNLVFALLIAGGIVYVGHTYRAEIENFIGEIRKELSGN